MIPKECKRLAEVDFPIAVVSKHAAREKSGPSGHPSKLHLWWARRPLAACRSMLLALLLPDPCDEHCPPGFKVKARDLLGRIPGQTRKFATSHRDEELRKALLQFIGEFANWDLSSNQNYLEVSRGLVRAAHGDEPPLVVDPFAGGGSIPLEALRLGCEAFASDLNPLACLILKTMLEDIPRHGPNGPGLGDDLRGVGAKIKGTAEKELADFYPAEPDGARPVAYLWARTVKCESPNCGAEIPIFKTAWLSKKGSKRAKWFREADDGSCVALLMDSTPKGGPVKFRIAHGEGSEHPQRGFRELRATKASGNNSNVICPCCNLVLHGERVMAQLSRQRGGCDVRFDVAGQREGGAYLLAVISQSPNGKAFRLPTDRDYEAVFKAATKVANSAEYTPTENLNPVRPSPNARGLTAPTRYGAQCFSDLFTARQRLAIKTLADITMRHLDNASTTSLASVLALGRNIDQTSAHVSWINNIEAIGHSFPRQAIQMVWDFVESVPIGEESANYRAATEWVSKVADRVCDSILSPGQIQQASATDLPLPDESGNVFFTDPPYYDAVPYADLADFFLVWLKKSIPDGLLAQLRFDQRDHLSPKTEECVWNRAHQVDGKPKDSKFFEACVSAAFSEGWRILAKDGIACVVFAHKTTEGWEALLSGLLAARWVIHASWPIVTERGVRTNAQNTASLVSSIHLVCRPRTEATIGDWAEVFRELPKRVGDWMERLESEGVRGADLVFACIGPALEIYSRYAKVVDAEEREIPLGGNPEATEPHLRGYLSYVWEVVGRTALEQVLGTAEARARNGAAGALEEDARLTALFLWTMQSTNGSEQKANGTVAEDDTTEDDDEDDASSTRASKKGFSLLFDVVRRFAQPLGIRLPEWEGRIIETKKGVVRLLSVTERARQLFGEEGAEVVADRLETDSRLPLTGWLPGLEPKATAPSIKGRGRKSATDGRVSDESLRTHREATTLDRVHAAMILQSSGRANALRALLKSEQERGPDFVRLANALSALYPKDSEEKRLLDAMLLAVPR
jgi:putative DNA methylase